MEYEFDEYDEREADFLDGEFREEGEEYDYGEEEEKEFVAGFKDFERVGMARDLEGPLIGGMIGEEKGEYNMREAHKKIMRMELSGSEKLKLLIDDYNRKYRNSEFWPITSDDLSNIYKNISKVNEPGYKNPVAFILGFVIVNKGQIDKNKFNEVVKDVLPHIQDDISIKSEDVLRYARLWLNLF